MTKPTSEFHKAATKRGFQSRCKLCQKDLLKQKRAANPERYRAYKRASDAKQRANGTLPIRQRHDRLRKMYGISLEQYNVLYASQAGRCAMCGDEAPAGGVKGLHVDHDHGTGAIRELLCPLRNRGLGAFRDREDILTAAIQYLKRHKEEA